jgi:aminoglycoside/choline kinase family phosphotransferase
MKLQNTIEENLTKLYEYWAEEAPPKITPMPAHGSDRQYFRILGEAGSAIGAHNRDRRENVAFLHFSRTFREAGLPVPEIYAEDIENGVYLQEDLGDTTLFSYLSEMREKEGLSEKIIRMYEKVVELLPQFQITAGRKLDYRLCYPRGSFDKQSMMWDLNYFKYYFLKLAKIPFDEQYLEDDFQEFTDFLLQADRDFFLYRDFQSRNIMICDGQPYFIDYQGGRKGALQYDIASLLFDAKADIPQEVRDRLLEKYIEAVSQLIPVDREKFMQFYYGYVFIRIMQALGAYGFRGFYERKTHFLKSVPYAIQNLEWLLRTAKLPVELPALTDAWKRLVRSSFLRQLGDAELRMTVRIQSFSFKRGIPIDENGHGGGFVFDCRLLPNPGRLPEYAGLTGNDRQVIDFLQKQEAVEQFFGHIKSIVEQAIANYQSRNFTDLMVLFGCTGGQHRSVYMTNLLAKHLRDKHKVNVEVRHRELEFMQK